MASWDHEDLKSKSQPYPAKAIPPQQFLKVKEIVEIEVDNNNFLGYGILNENDVLIARFLFKDSAVNFMKNIDKGARLVEIIG